MLSPWLSDLRKVPMLPLAASAGMGVVVALYVEISAAILLWLCLAIGVLAAIRLFAFRRVWLGAAFLLFFMAILAAYRTTSALDRPARRAVAAMAEGDDRVEVSGVVALPASDSPARNRVILADCSLKDSAQGVNTRNLRVRLYADSVTLRTLRYGDYVVAIGRLGSGRELSSTRGALIASVVRHEMASVYADSLTIAVIPEKGVNVRRMVDDFRDWSRAVFHRYLSGDGAALSSALVLGDRGEFGHEFSGQLRVTGLSHIFALSGMNTGLVIIVVWLCLSWLPIPHSLKLWILLAATLLYMEVGREAPSLVRASLVGAAFVIGSLLHRRAVFLNLILAAAFAELLWKPLDLIDPGFLLSYFAVLGLIGGYQFLRESLTKLWRKRPPAWFRYAAGILAGTGAAQIATLPLVAFLFHRAPLFGALGNIVAVPGFAIMLVLSLLLLLISAVVPFAAPLLAPAVNSIGWLLGAAVHLAASLPYSSVVVPPFSSLVLILLVVATGVMLLGMGYRQWRWMAVAVLLGVNVILWAKITAPPAPDCSITFFDVENGDATLISASGRHVLVDTGPQYRNWSAAGRILPFLNEHQIDHLDAIILTHPDNDHIGGTADILRAIPVDHVFTNGDSSASYTFLTTLLTAKQTGHEFETLSAGQKLNLSPTITLSVLSPDSDLVSRQRMDNRKSIVMRLQTRGTSALLLGDADSTIEQQLAAWGDLVDVDLLKCAHHGSKSSTSDSLLAMATPSLAVISAGKHNLFHHPSPEVLARLESQHVPYVMTLNLGNITYETLGRHWVRKPSDVEQLMQRWRLAA